MQSDVPGGHAAGAEVSLDEDDIAMQDYLREVFESDFEDEERVVINGNEELREGVDGYLMLCDAQSRRWVYECRAYASITLIDCFQKATQA